MNILLATIFNLPAEGGGGLWSYAYHLKKGLESRGHSVDILAHHPNENRFYLLGNERSFPKQPVRTIDSMWVAGFEWFRLAQVEPLIRLLEIERYYLREAAMSYGLDRYDAIHAQDVIAAQVLAQAKPPQTPLITTAHGSMAYEYINQGIASPDSFLWCYAGRQDYSGVLCSDAVIVPSRWLRDKLAHDCSAPEYRMTVIPNGMDTEGFLRRMGEPVVDAPPIPDGRKVIVCVGRLVQDKGQGVLLRALARLKAERRDWICWLIGEGPARAELMRETQELRLENHVAFLGGRKDVPALLRQADLFVMPSLDENMPYALMEAMLAGKPVVASDVGGIPEMMGDGAAGLLSPAGQERPLASCLLRLLEDPALRARVAENGRIRAMREYGMGTMVSRVLEVYGKLLSVRKRKR